VLLTVYGCGQASERLVGRVYVVFSIGFVGVHDDAGPAGRIVEDRDREVSLAEREVSPVDDDSKLANSGDAQ
jgi:hypothetical protein